MKNNLFTYLAICAISMLMYQSCSLEPYVISAEEQYTREFLKRFGHKIDPEQDWNEAKKSSVTVNVGQSAASVKVFAKMYDAYYGVASLKNVSGELEIPLDVPKFTNELKIEVDGRTYFAAVGGKIDVNNPASRTALPHEHGTTPVLGSHGDAAVSVGSTYYEFDMDVIRTITGSDGVLPEGGDNYNKKGIVKNFSIKYTGPFTFYPVYFNTDGIHVLGVYWLTDASDPDKVKIYVDPGADETYGTNYDEYDTAGLDDEYIYIKKQPIYKDKVGSELQWRSNDPKANKLFNWEPGYGESSDEGSEIPEGYTKVGDFIYPVKDGNIFTEAHWNTTAGTEDRTQIPRFVTDDDSYRALINNVGSYLAPPTGFSTLNSDIFNTDALGTDNFNTLLSIFNTFLENYPGWIIDTDASTIIPYSASYLHMKLYFKKPDGEGGSSYFWHDYVAPDAAEQGAWGPIQANLDETHTETHGVTTFADADGMRALPITVDLGNVANGDPNFKFGFYIDVYPNYDIDFSEGVDHTIYSNAKLNQKFSAGKPSDYALAAKYTTQVNGEDRMFFSFEDWAMGHIDLNDLIFMIKSTAESGDEDFVPPTFVEGDIDEEDPTPTINTLSWIVAVEDLGSFDDFDFNDVIFQLQSITVTEDDNKISKKVNVQALAAGGILEAYLHYSDGINDYLLGPNNTILNNTGNNGTNPPAGYKDCEWHRWFGTDQLIMINTGRNTPVPNPGQCDISSIATINFSVEDYSRLDQQMYDWGGYHTFVQGFYVTVNTTAAGSTMDQIDQMNDEHARRLGNHITKGNVPQMFLIPDVGHIAGKTWYWPKERRYINDTYPAFGNWIENSKNYEWHRTIGEQQDNEIIRAAQGVNNGTF